MGHLKQVLFIGEIDRKGRIDADTLKPVCISYRQLLESSDRVGLPDSSHRASRQLPDCSRIRMPYKESPLPQGYQGLQPSLATGTSKYGNKYQGNAVISQEETVLLSRREQAEQSVDEWVADYNG
jgi:hypothetical protein